MAAAAAKREGQVAPFAQSRRSATCRKPGGCCEEVIREDVYGRDDDSMSPIAKDWNPQGQPIRNGRAEYRQLLISLSPHGFIKAAQQAGMRRLRTAITFGKTARLRSSASRPWQVRVTGEFQ